MDSTPSALVFFVPGRLSNPLNSRKGWRGVWASSRDWRQRTADAALLALKASPKLEVVNIASPAVVTFRAHVWRLYDDEGVIAACKPLRDGLARSSFYRRSGRLVSLPGAELIHSDAPDSGHTFKYKQVVDRANLGVEITVARVRSTMGGGLAVVATDVDDVPATLGR